MRIVHQGRLLVLSGVISALLAAVPAIRPDVTVIHAQKADRKGNVLMWGVVGVQKEAVLAAKRGETRGEWLARLNPMTVPIEFFRAATLSTPIAAGRVLISFLVNGALCLAGLYYFRHVEDSFADVI